MTSRTSRFGWPGGKWNWWYKMLPVWIICLYLLTAFVSSSELKGGVNIFERNALVHNVEIIVHALLAVATPKTRVWQIAVGKVYTVMDPWSFLTTVGTLLSCSDKDFSTFFAHSVAASWHGRCDVAAHTFLVVEVAILFFCIAWLGLPVLLGRWWNDGGFAWPKDERAEFNLLIVCFNSFRLLWLAALRVPVSGISLQESSLLSSFWISGLMSSIFSSFGCRMAFLATVPNSRTFCERNCLHNGQQPASCRQIFNHNLQGVPMFRHDSQLDRWKGHIYNSLLVPLTNGNQ